MKVGILDYFQVLGSMCVPKSMEGSCKLQRSWKSAVSDPETLRNPRMVRIVRTRAVDIVNTPAAPFHWDDLSKFLLQATQLLWPH